MSEKKNVQHCTAKNPMPADRPSVGIHWRHHGVQPLPGEPKLEKVGDSAMYRCPNCGHEFRVTRRALAPAEKRRLFDNLGRINAKRKESQNG